MTKNKSTKAVAAKTTATKKVAGKKDASATTKSKSKTNSTRETKLEVFVKKNQSDYPTGTWVVFTTEGEKRKQPRVFESNLSRDKVRCAYAKTLGCSIQETRSRRVENY